MRPLLDTMADLASGRTTSRALVEGCLARITDRSGEGPRAFLDVDVEGVREAADCADRLRRRAMSPSPFAGIPVSVKDLFDVKGQVTRAGSKVLAANSPATRDAIAVARLRAAGFIIIGRTNMTEFAYSGLGLNPHYGTPLNPYDRKTGRVPGGSSSGAAVSVCDGMAAVAIGTDTGGSCRIPAAFTGLVGFKPTARRVPLDGTVPLSSSLDSVGPIGHTVACCAVVDAILSGVCRNEFVPATHPAGGLRLAVPQSLVLDDLDDHVARCFDAALNKLSRAGATIIEEPFRELLELPSVNAKGGLAAAEAYAWHRRYLQTQSDSYDPRVRVRILKGQEQTAADYVDLLTARANLKASFAIRAGLFDAVVMPTVAIVAPTLAQLTDDGDYARLNQLALRNTGIANFLDVCAISLPIHQPGEAPVGLMLMGRHGEDSRLLSIAEGMVNLLCMGLH